MKIGRHVFSLPTLAIAIAPTVVGGAIFLFIAWTFPAWVQQSAAVWGPLAVLLSALSAVLTAVVATTLSAEAQMNVAKVKAAYEAVSNKLWDADYIKARFLYLTALRQSRAGTGPALASYAAIVQHESAQMLEMADSIRNVVNDHELTAIAIRQNVLDEDFIKSWGRSSLVADFVKMKPYIDEVRRLADNSLIFNEFEQLATRWTAEIAAERRDTR